MIYLISNQTSLEDEEIKLATIQDCYDYLVSCSVFGIDIETTRKYNKYLDF